jgi:hypothetical protein
MTFTVIQVFKLIAKLLDDRNNLMVLLNITELNLGDLLILLKMFKKTAVSLKELDVGPAEPFPTHYVVNTGIIRCGTEYSQCCIVDILFYF